MLLVVQGVDIFDVERGVLKGWIVDGADVVEQVAGQGGVGVDDGPGEAEVVVVFGDLLVDGGVVDGDGRNGRGHRDSRSSCGFHGEEAAIDFFFGGGWEDFIVGGDELDADVVEREGGVAVVGKDDADGDEGVLDVGESEEVAVFRVGAGIGGDGEFFVRVSVEGGILVGGFCRGSFFLFGLERGGKEAEGNCEKRNCGDPIGLHGQVDYHLG